ncbi:MAG TPA: hypothetical protein VGS61_01635, partial [Acidimicrobiales bacterium]|nr:hypothetical protein [Acidimicrobiales bacterium]
MCTIVAPNYVGHLLVLAESVAQAMPDAEFVALILQDCDDVSEIQRRVSEVARESADPTRFRVVAMDEVDWGDFDVAAAAVFYDILEFATSVKPALLRWLVGRGPGRVTYLDPDVQVFSDFTGLLDADADVALTPHFLSDIPVDGHRPSTNDVLLAGFYNLGFCSVGPTSRSFLDWWSRRLQFDCRNAHLKGYFTDQKILDLAPLKARVQTVLDPGCNVAYWNLHERRVVPDGEGWAVAHQGSLSPLHFFHFSGFPSDSGSSLSIHASRKVVGDEVPRAFATQYERRRREAGSGPELGFTLGGYPLGSVVPRAWRNAAREDVEVHVRAGHDLADVAADLYRAPDDTDAACRFCGRRHEGAGSRARRLLEGWALHPALNGVPNGVAAFFRADHHELSAPAMAQLSWASEHLERELPGMARLRDDLLAAGAAAVREAAALVLVGYFTYPAGSGQIARWTLRTLEAAGVRPAIERVYSLSDSTEHLSELLARRNPLAASNASALCLVNADQWQAHVLDRGRVNPSVQQVEAVWAWELEEVPPLMYHLAASGQIARVHGLS